MLVQGNKGISSIRSLVVGLSLIFFSPPAKSEFRFHDWKVQALTPKGHPLCVIVGKVGVSELRIWMYPDQSLSLLMQVQNERSLLRTLMREDWYSISGYTELSFELDGKNWGVPFEFLGQSDRAELIIRARRKVQTMSEILSETPSSPEGLAQQSMQIIREDADYRRRLISFISQHKNLRITAGETVLATFSLSGFSEAYGAFNRCLNNGGRL